MLSLTWIDPNPADIRKKELERAKALAHASRVSHSRRKAAAKRFNVSKNSLPSVTPVAWQFSDDFRAAGLEPKNRTREVVHVLTTAWAPNKQDVPLPTIFVRYITDPLRDDSLTAEAILPLLAAAQRGTNSPILNSEILKYKSRIMLKLRSAIAAGDAPLTSMISLFTAAILDDNTTEAGIHSEALRMLVVKETKTVDKFNFEGLTFRSDDKSMLNASVMGRPPRASESSGRIKSPWLDFLRPLYEIFERTLDPTLEGTLREICLDRMANMWLLCRCSRVRYAEPNTLDGFFVSHFVTGAIHSVQLRMSDYIASLQEQLNDRVNCKTPMDYIYLHRQAAASFSYFAFVAFFANASRAAECVAEVRHHLEGLYAAAQLCTYGVVLERKLLFNNLLLFIHWIGASWERGQMTVRDRENVQLQNWWFTKGFVLLALALNLRDWNQVRGILNGFCPSNLLPPPYTSDWVDQALREKQRSKVWD